MVICLQEVEVRSEQSKIQTCKRGEYKVFARRATCGEMTGRGVYSIHYDSSHGPKDIIYNVFAWAGKKLAAGRIWPVGRTLDVPDVRGTSIRHSIIFFKGCLSFSLKGKMIYHIWPEVENFLGLFRLKLFF